MSDKIVTLARYYDGLHAQLVKNRLEAEGVPTFMTGEALPGFLGTSIASVELQVTEEHLRRAMFLLAQWEEEDTDTDAVDEPDDLGQKLPEDTTAIQPTRRTRETHVTSKQARRDHEEEADQPDITLSRKPHALTWLLLCAGVVWLGLIVLAISRGFGP